MGAASGTRLRSLVAGVCMGVVSGVALLAGAQDQGPVTSGTMVVPYDGFLTRGGEPINGTVDITFHLHTGATCNNCEVWSEIQPVPIRGGRFSVALGAYVDLSYFIKDSEKLWLSMDVEGAPLGGRQVLEAAPFAYWTARGGALAAAGLTPVEGRDAVGITHPVTYLDGNTISLSDNSNGPRRAMTYVPESKTLRINPNGDFPGGIHLMGFYAQLSAGPMAINGNLSAPTIRTYYVNTASVSVVPNGTATPAISGPITPSLQTSWADCGTKIVTAIRFSVLDASGSPRRALLNVDCR